MGWCGMLSREKDGDRFAGAVVGLGALGVVTRMTLAVQPRYEMTQVVYRDLPFASLEQGSRGGDGGGL